MSFADPERIREGLKGKSAEVLRLIALQPKRPPSKPPSGEPIPVYRPAR